MITIKRNLPILTALLLAGCGGGGERPATVAEKPVSYAVPVSVPCVAAAGRPARPQPLKQRYSDAAWAAMPPGAKAQAVAAQAGERLNYEDADAAATAGCK